jgi:hypothetical protein
MGIIKLQNAGDAVTWRIKKAETVAGKFGAQVKFENDSGDILFISEETAGRQLGRIPLDIDTCAGELLTFSRTENPKGGAPYWNITVADAVDRAAPTQSKRLPPPKRVIPGLDDLPEAGLGAMDAVSYERQATPPTDDDAPEWVREEPKGVAPNAEKKKAYINAYIDLLGYVRAHSGLKDEVAIQAATATLHIGLKQEGLR